MLSVWGTGVHVCGRVQGAQLLQPPLQLAPQKTQVRVQTLSSPGVPLSLFSNPKHTLAPCIPLSLISQLAPIIQRLQSAVAATPPPPQQQLRTLRLLLLTALRAQGSSHRSRGSYAESADSFRLGMEVAKAGSALRGMAEGEVKLLKLEEVLCTAE